MANQTCDIKSIREDLIEDISEKVVEDEVYTNISNLFKLFGDYNRVRIICALPSSRILCM
ncbi:hypothetical protein ALNOE001_05710 [Candidatus Methanobinarius endosymbioticus]|uniref:HTH arsR-type domain-containing protein n=1 Tax=Candidatus Methanobinarius endosymbioticus TaxID=2006182 RepID=A0A366MCV0_9EURY|nr:hypothetical protein ALNOE001_05710 [Candidatus Methanobinarius endosymbioticus]